MTTTFVRGGLEPPDRRTRYLDDIQAASTSLATLSRQVSTTASGRAAVSRITDGVPTYTGLVEAARAYNRQGLPVGAAYLRRASELLATSILPAANRLYETEATRLNDDYRSGVGTGTLVAFVLAGLASLALLLLLGRYLARLSHRILNVPIVAGTVISLVLFVWGIVGLTGEQSALARAQRDGSDSVEILSATRILASRAQSDESLALVSRGGDAKPSADFDAVMQALDPTAAEASLAAVAAQAQRTGRTGPRRAPGRAHRLPGPARPHRRPGCRPPLHRRRPPPGPLDAAADPRRPTAQPRPRRPDRGGPAALRGPRRRRDAAVRGLTVAICRSSRPRRRPRPDRPRQRINEYR